MLVKPYVGQKVKLSRAGYAALKLTTPEAFEESKELTITQVNQIGLPDDPVWDIHVDKLSIGMFMLHQGMFDPL